VAAAGRADVVARDPQPLVLGGGGQHAFQELAVAGLEVVLSAQRPARVGEPIRKRVANALQLVEAGDARLAEGSWNAGVEIETEKSLGAEARQLVFEPADLAPQLNTREALVASHLKRREHVSIEQIWHRLESSVDHSASAVP
jgi:hypothetical protein